MRLANLDGRAVVVLEGATVDVARASGGRFGPCPMSLFEQWAAFVDFARGLGPADASASAPAGAGPRWSNPVPLPRQVFAIGLNYRSHAAESGMAVPEVPATFTEFPACLAGPYDDVEVVGAGVDWETELVAVIGELADRVSEADGWSHVAGLTVGQDLSDRHLQFAAGGQFSLGKSRRGYGPMGPWLVTPDELADRDDLRLGCSVDGEVLQDGRTGDMVFGVARLVAELSAVVPLLPGDVIFTGTPAGIGIVRQPPRLLGAGQTLETWVEGVGSIRNRLV